MKVCRRIVVFTLVGVWLIWEVSALSAKGKYSTLTGTVRGIHVHGFRKWLEVENGQDKAVVNFRVGRNTAYKPHRYPHVGEKVKVEYLTHRGVPVAYTVTILEEKK